MWSLGFLFIVCFGAATLLPGGSEAVLVGMLQQQSAPVVLLLLVATLGNSLGSMTSYLLGYWGRRLRPDGQNSERYQRVTLWVDKYGYWSLTMSWLPLFGDLLCLVAGWRKFPLLPSCLLILLGKGVRYGVLVWLFFSVS